MSTDVDSRGLDRRFYVFLLCFYAAWSLRVVLLLPVDRVIENAWAQQCWSQGLRLLLWVLPPVLYLRWVDGVNPVRFLRLDSWPRGRRLLTALGIMGGFLLLISLGSLTFQGGSLDGLRAMTGRRWGGLLAVMLMISFCEEVLYRGFIFQKLRAAYSFRRANLVSSGLFLLIHFPGWLYMQGAHRGLFALGGAIVLVSVVLGWLVEVTRSLWPAVLLHLLNNVCSALLRP